MDGAVAVGVVLVPRQLGHLRDGRQRVVEQDGGVLARDRDRDGRRRGLPGGVADRVAEAVERGLAGAEPVEADARVVAEDAARARDRRARGARRLDRDEALRHAAVVAEEVGACEREAQALAGREGIAVRLELQAVQEVDDRLWKAAEVRRLMAGDGSGQDGR
jgi:hypothetical protein